MNPETQLYHWIRSNLPGHYVRIENTSEAGTPDINMCCQGNEAWIECKIMDEGDTFIRAPQYAWGMRRSKENGRIFIISLEENIKLLHIWRYPIQVKRVGQGSIAVDGPPLVKIPKTTKGSVQLRSLLFPGVI